MTKDNKPPYEVELVDQLADIMQTRELSEIKLETETLSLKLSRATGQVISPVTFAPPQPAMAQAPQVSAPLSSTPEPKGGGQAGIFVTSPMVGTVYLSAAPEKPPFVRVGDKVRKGETVLIIEAMKTFNEVYADKDGEVAEILVDNQSPVEFGQNLIRLI